MIDRWMRMQGLRSGVSLWLLAAAVLVGGCAPGATKGTMPPPRPDGMVDPAGVPDFIAVAGADGGSPGYVPAHFLLDPATEEPIPVYADDLVTLVGHMFPGRGFVALGIEPQSVPTFPTGVGPPPGDPSRRSLTIYVHNASDRTVWIAVLRGEAVGDAQGYDAPGMGCLGIEPGDRLVRLAVAPREVPLQIVETMFVDRGGELPARWLDVAADGSATHGEGVPSWWTSGPPPCDVPTT
jgi:hypothetical protein